MGLDLSPFADVVGSATSGPVWIAGQQSRVTAPTSIRQVTAPSGIYDLQPDEMTVVCGAGTSIDELQDALRAVGQYVNLSRSNSGSGTVGGALATGRSDIYRLGRGAIRDTLLQARYVNHDGQVVSAGGPTVKNVSGFDLCRLLVGSVGQLGFLGEVILRTRPIPQSSRWFMINEARPETVEAILRRVYRPASVLWDGRKVWFCIEGNSRDCDKTIQQLCDLEEPSEVAGPPELGNFPFRQSVPPTELAGLVQGHLHQGTVQLLVEAGVGIIHRQTPAEPKATDKTIELLHQRMLQQFNPTGRLNPGVSLTAGSTV
ncbi:MAG: FAD-binding oxidoreductase [Actinomycetes bacterium]